jgi:hypothetical protein
VDAGSVTEAVALLRAGVDGLLAASLSAESSVEVAQLLTSLETERRRLAAVDQRVLAEVTDRGIAGDYARTSPTDLLVTNLRVTPAEAKARLDRARDLGPRRTVTGEALDPILPATAAAVAAGEISGRHATVITKCIEQIPPDIAHEAAPVAERMLVEAARHEHPGLLATTARMLLMRLDPDGAEPRDAEIERKRGYGLRKFADGSSSPYGRFDPEVTAMWEAVLDSLAAPLPAADGMADDRTPSQRRHDAMGEAARRLLASDTLSSTAGTPVTVMATITMQELIDKAGVATTAHGDHWSVQQLLTIACDAQIVPVIFNDAGGILAYGRTRRLASTGQRLALIARDGGCAFPGCTRPAPWTEVHHIHEWLDGGDTDIDNMCLLCRFHHREFAKRGWQVTMSDDGVPEWIPPPFIDPDRKPVRNTAHHQRDLTFTA